MGRTEHSLLSAQLSTPRVLVFPTFVGLRCAGLVQAWFRGGLEVYLKPGGFGRVYGVYGVH